MKSDRISHGLPPRISLTNHWEVTDIHSFFSLDLAAVGAYGEKLTDGQLNNLLDAAKDSNASAPYRSMVMYLYFHRDLALACSQAPRRKGNLWDVNRASQALESSLGLKKFGPILPGFEYYLKSVLHFIEGDYDRLAEMYDIVKTFSYQMPGQFDGVFTFDNSLMQKIAAHGLQPTALERNVSFEIVDIDASIGSAESDKSYLIAGDMSYFRRYGGKMVSEFNKKVRIDADLRIAVACNEYDEVFEEIRNIRNEQDVGNNVKFYVTQIPNFVHKRDMVSFYACVRFYFALHIIKTISSKCIVYDMDIEFNKDYQGKLWRIFDEFDVGLFFNGGVRATNTWRKIAAGCMAFNNTDSAEKFLRLCCYAISETLSSERPKSWFVDQNVLTMVEKCCEANMLGVRVGAVGGFGPEFVTKK